MESSVSSKSCSTCGKVFSEYVIAVGDRCYHPSCFVCSICHCHLEENKFSVKNVGRCRIMYIGREHFFVRNVMLNSFERGV